MEGFSSRFAGKGWALAKKSPGPSVLRLSWLHGCAERAGGIGWFPVDSPERYHRMMWHNGPVAMSIASGLYLMLFVWASKFKAPQP